MRLTVGVLKTDSMNDPSPTRIHKRLAAVEGTLNVFVGVETFCWG
jgi:hypothetical protein